MMIIIILTASYIGDDVRIVYALAIYDAIFFGNGWTDGQGNSRSRKPGFFKILNTGILFSKIPVSVFESNPGITVFSGTTQGPGHQVVTIVVIII